MELTLPQAAVQTDIPLRSLQRGIQSGSLQPSRRVGSHLLVDDIALTTWTRAQGRGRLWSDLTVRAALELLDQGETNLVAGTVLSRLKGRLREITIPQLAYVLGGIEGRWNRFRSSWEHQPDQLHLIGPSSVDAFQLGIAASGGWMTFAEAQDVADIEIDMELIRDPSGNVGIVERAGTEGLTRTLLDTYLLGDARESLLAQRALEGRLPK